MIFHPKIGQSVAINYKDKSMPYQRWLGVVTAVGNGKGPKNVLIEINILRSGGRYYVVIPRGNLIATDG